jgi:hypothetical protein
MWKEACICVRLPKGCREEERGKVKDRERERERERAGGSEGASNDGSMDKGTDKKRKRRKGKESGRRESLAASLFFRHMWVSPIRQKFSRSTWPEGGRLNTTPSIHMDR